MGNYYSGMMNATGGSELRHHGILGQKWGVRRFQNKDGTWTEAGKKKRRLSGKDRRVKDYFDRKGDSESFDRYESMDKSGKKNVRRAVEDLEGPHGIKGYYENANLKSIVPPFKAIGKRLRNERLTRGEARLKEAFGNANEGETDTYTGRSRKNYDAISAAHSKVTRDMPGGGSIKDIRKNLMNNAKNDSERMRIQKNESKLREIIQKGADTSKLEAAEKRMNDFKDKHMKGLIVTKKNQQIYDQLKNDYYKENENAWFNLSDSVEAYVSKLPKNEQAQWYAIAYKEMGLDW